jgi:hypothetical protein
MLPPLIIQAGDRGQFKGCVSLSRQAPAQDRREGGRKLRGKSFYSYIDIFARRRNFTADAIEARTVVQCHCRRCPREAIELPRNLTARGIQTIGFYAARPGLTVRIRYVIAHHRLVGRKTVS